MESILYQGDYYLDDRIFVLEIRRAMSTSESKPDELPWVLLTLRNVRGFRPTRADDFESWVDVVEYVEKIEPQTPRISLGGEAPDPVPSYDEYLQWCQGEGIRSALAQINTQLPREK